MKNERMSNGVTNTRGQYYVYLHISKETGKVLYVGKGSKNGRYDRAYNTIGRPCSINDIIVKKIEFFDDEQEALRAEAEYIKFFSLTDEIVNKDIPTKIYCKELNTVFYSLGEAVKECERLNIHLDRGAISRCLNGERKHCGYILDKDNKKIRLSWQRV